MQQPSTDFIDCSSLKEEEIVAAIKHDFLYFCLHYHLNNKQLTFILPNGVRAKLLDDGVIVFEPLSDSGNSKNTDLSSKNIVLSCGVHGNETAPIEICQQLINDLLSQKLLLSHRVMFIFGNIPSMLITQRFVEENLNRLFNVKISTSSAEGKRARKLMAYVQSFFEGTSAARYHYDLHTAIRASKNEKFAVYPFLHGKNHSKEQLAFLSQCGVNTILLSQSPTATFSYFSSFNFNAHAFTVELGKVKPFGENDMSKFVAVKDNLRALISQNSVSLKDYANCDIEVFSVNQVINKQQEDFRLHFSDEIANFTAFRQGETLASETGAKYVAEHEDEAIVFPNADVAIGQRALLTVIPHEL